MRAVRRWRSVAGKRPHQMAVPGRDRAPAVCRGVGTEGPRLRPPGLRCLLQQRVLTDPMGRPDDGELPSGGKAGVGALGERQAHPLMCFHHETFRVSCWSGRAHPLVPNGDTPSQPLARPLRRHPVPPPAGTTGHRFRLWRHAYLPLTSTTPGGLLIPCLLSPSWNVLQTGRPWVWSHGRGLVSADLIRPSPPVRGLPALCHAPLLNYSAAWKAVLPRHPWCALHPSSGCATWCVPTPISSVAVPAPHFRAEETEVHTGINDASQAGRRLWHPPRPTRRPHRLRPAGTSPPAPPHHLVGLHGTSLGLPQGNAQVGAKAGEMERGCMGGEGLGGRTLWNLEWQAWLPIATPLRAPATACPGDLTPAVDVSDRGESLVNTRNVDAETPLLEAGTPQGAERWCRLALIGQTVVSECQRLQSSP